MPRSTGFFDFEQETKTSFQLHQPGWSIVRCIVMGLIDMVWKRGKRGEEEIREYEKKDERKEDLGEGGGGRDMAHG
jgi:hypothetical protein